MSRGQRTRWIVRQWRNPTLAGSLLLVPASWIFRALVAIRRLAYRLRLRPVARLPVPVVVVGNVTVGGSGKTPLVMHLVGHLQDHGWRPGVVSRGHGGSDPRPRRIDPAPDPIDSGDEPTLIALRCGCPVAVGADRAAAARLLVGCCDVIVADDGLQHYALGRDIEIAVVDGEGGLGNGRLLPAGPLREPPGRLREAAFVAVRDGGDAEARRPDAYGFRVHPGAARQVGDSPRTRPLADWRGHRVHAVAGIGVPERFFGQLHDAGLELERHAFADHHPFRADDLAFGDDAPILMTEKDAVKCRAFADERMWFLPAEVDDAAGLAGAVTQRLVDLGHQSEEGNGSAAA